MKHYFSFYHLKKLSIWYGAVFLLLAISFLAFYSAIHLLPESTSSVLDRHLYNLLSDKKLLIFIGVGFIAQMIDGALGMAYGVSSTSFLMATGVHPKLASAAVHVAEIFTTGISGLSHFRMGNIDKKLFLSLLIPGAIGAATGAYILTNFDGNLIKPFVSVYLLLMGIYIILKAIKERIQVKETNSRGTRILAFVGGFVDAVGGGGWGPVVTTTLIGSGQHPRKVIGSVNAAEFLVTITASTVFIMSINELSDMLAVIIGLILGGALAAPLGAIITKFIPVKTAMIIVGCLIIFLSCFTLSKVLF